MCSVCSGCASVVCVCATEYPSLGVKKRHLNDGDEDQRREGKLLNGSVIDLQTWTEGHRGAQHISLCIISLHVSLTAFEPIQMMSGVAFLSTANMGHHVQGRTVYIQYTGHTKIHTQSLSPDFTLSTHSHTYFHNLQLQSAINKSSEHVCVFLCRTSV